jgi:hypothetical protein
MTALRLYSRPECHLCEELLDQLRPMLGPDDTVTIVDITDDIGLERKYNLRIPVLTASDGTELSEYPLDAERVRAFLGAR